jgi:hypothetical protein
MKNRNSALVAIGLAAAITLGGAATALAQDTTRARSQTRIPVRKDQPAAAVARTDTVTIVRTDTVVQSRTDTVTVTRVDTVTRVEELPLQPLKTWQFGIGVGAAFPTADFRNVIQDGYDVHAHLGVFPGASSFGIRLDGDWVAFGNRDEACASCPGTKLIQGSANIVLRFPLDRKSPVNPQIYFLGGGGIDKFTDFTPYRTGDGNTVTAGSDTFTGAGSGVAASAVSDKSLFYHWDVGGGITLGRFFIESKYVSINTDGDNTAYVPVTIGLNF